jgi:hypothetical protein
MSAATPEPGRARPGGVLGVAVGLLALVGLAAGLGMQALGGSGAPPEELLAGVLPAPRPWGLELVGSAALPSGDRVLRLAPADGAQVREVVLTLAASRGAVEALFQPVGEWGDDDPSETLAKWRRDPSSEHVLELERGEVGWRGWEAPFVRKRALHAGGGWSDATAVNLSTHGRDLVLVVLWEPETEGPEELLRELLRAVAIPADETAGPG